MHIRNITINGESITFLTDMLIATVVAGHIIETFSNVLLSCVRSLSFILSLVKFYRGNE